MKKKQLKYTMGINNEYFQVLITDTEINVSRGQKNKQKCNYQKIPMQKMKPIHIVFLTTLEILRGYGSTLMTD